ncbi:putative glycoside hydrolase [Lacimicrobium alkaliphilum]|nr:putative glycoside hydrolase [Lacimicrobium alkaliphilum]
MTVVTDALQHSTHGAISAEATDRHQQEDSVVISFTADGVLALAHDTGATVDLARLAEGDMALEIEYQLLSLTDNTSLSIGMACGSDCGASLDFTEYFSEQQGRGWQSLKVPLRCFTDMDMTRVTSPLVLQGSAGTVIQLANVRLANNEGQGQCGQ